MMSKSKLVADPEMKVEMEGLEILVLYGNIFLLQIIYSFTTLLYMDDKFHPNFHESFYKDIYMHISLRAMRNNRRCHILKSA